VELVPPLETTRADEPVPPDIGRFVADLAAALRRRLEHPLAPEARHSLAAALRPHAWSAVFDRYERVYERLQASRALHIT
jgi:hypothetical protein